MIMVKYLYQFTRRAIILAAISILGALRPIGRDSVRTGHKANYVIGAFR